MGYLRRHAIVVSGFSPERVGRVHAAAREIFAGVAPVTEMTGPAINGEASFLVAPVGSKEGWVDSDKGDAARDKFIAWLRDPANEAWVEWVEVSFGEDEPRAAVIRSGDDDQKEPGHV